MMRDPYKPRRDYGRVGVITIGVLALVVVVLLAFLFFRPGPTAEQDKAEQAFETQMDQSEARYEAQRKTEETKHAESME